MEKKPEKMITMSNLGDRSHGRFGNQVFQYAFLRIYAAQYYLGIETSPWIGQYLFGHQDPPVTHTFPLFKSNLRNNSSGLRDLFKSNTPPFVNIDLYGQFIFHTGFYRPFKSFFRSLFQPEQKILNKVSEGMAELRRRGDTIIGVHIRRGDFHNYKNHTRFWIAPTKWYNKWLSRVWPSLKNPLLFIASDDLNDVLPDFKQYNPVTSMDVINHFPNNTSFYPDSSFYPDFYILTQCDMLAISNSTFSFTASMLNKSCQSFMRPHYNDQKLIPFDPWNSSPKLDRNEPGKSSRDYLPWIR